jgi:hypothetical protein
MPVLLLYFIAITSAASGQKIFKDPLSPRIASYKIAVTLDPAHKTLNGTETLTWRNASPDRITELQFHLYLNGFKNSLSTFMKESRGTNRGIRMNAAGWGWIDVTSIATAEGEDLSRRIAFIHPDDDNGDDQTVFRVPLSKPIPPGQSIQLKIGFKAKLPRVFARTGYFQDFYMVGQWFPKIGVYEAAGQRYATEGQWNCHQFHANTEFYADYGVYDVNMTVPNEFILGATGILINSKENGDGTKTIAYHAEDVHDFAWTASPKYLDLTEQWRHVKIRVLMQPQRAYQAARYFESAKVALEYFDKHVGKYPYPNLTIVDPAYGATGAGGMEYPTLITAGSLWGVDSWLRILDENYGRKNSIVDLPGLSLGDLESSWMAYTSMPNPKTAPTATFGWLFKLGGYGTLTYQKTALFMTTFERLVGRAVMDTIMKTYFERWKFKHPCWRDYLAVANEVVPKYHGAKFGKDLSWYFDQVLFGTDVCDYELTSIENHEVLSTQGMVDRAGMKVQSEPERESTSGQKFFDSKVAASRLGEIKLPTSILVHFDNGEEVREAWDGQSRWVEFKYRRPEKVVWAKVDPDTVMVIDVDLSNNSKTTEQAGAPLWKYTVKFLYWLQNLLQLGAIFG